MVCYIVSLIIQIDCIGILFLSQSLGKGHQAFNFSHL